MNFAQESRGSGGIGQGGGGGGGGEADNDAARDDGGSVDKITDADIQRLLQERTASMPTRPQMAE